MLTKRIIPCLDVKNGKVVKGVQFKNHRIIGDPIKLATKYSEENADELVFYDIYSSVESKSVSLSWINDIAQNITDMDVKLLSTDEIIFDEEMLEFVVPGRINVNLLFRCMILLLL